MRKHLLACSAIIALGIPIAANGAAHTHIRLYCGGNELAAYPLDTYNHIEFRGDSWHLSSASDSDIAPVEIPFTSAEKMAFGTHSAADEITKSTSTLSYDANSHSLHLNAENTGEYTIAVYSMLGALLIQNSPDANGALPLDKLAAGIYIATASDGHTRLTLKFAVR